MDRAAHSMIILLCSPTYNKCCFCLVYDIAQIDISVARKCVFIADKINNFTNSFIQFNLKDAKTKA